MQPARIIKRRVVQDLHKSESIVKNLSRYQSEGFAGVISDDDMPEPKRFRRDVSALARLDPGMGRKGDTGEKDADNALLLFEVLQGLEPHLARDERFWAYLTHFPCRDYVWRRWIDAEKTEIERVQKIREKFFTRSERPFVRANAVSRLWWWAHIANRYERAPLDKTLRVLLSYTDVRDAIFGRPTIARSPKVFSGIMDILVERYEENGDNSFFQRRTSRRSGEHPYQLFLKGINRHGGVLLLDAMPENVLSALLMNLAHDAEKEPEAEAA